MTTPDDIARAFDAFLDAACAETWRLDPERAEAELEARRRDLRALAVRVDRSKWPRGVATLLWAPAPHELPNREPPAEIVEIPGPASDCPACE